MVVELSLIISTRNRLDRLKRCLEALLNVNTKHKWELIIVDNGSSDGTAPYLASLQSVEWGPSIRTFVEQKRGKGRALNAVWRAAKGSIIAFTDDDCYVNRDYVDAVISAFDREVGFVGGRVLLFDREDFPTTIITSETPFDLHPYTFVAAGDLLGANIAFRRETLDLIGGFDVNLGPGTKFIAEDTDVQARAVWNGITGAYDPRIVVFHHHGRKELADVRKLIKYYDKGRGAYYAKMILGKRSRRTYLRIWKIKVIEDFKSARTIRNRWSLIMRFSRELFGAAQYIYSILWRPSNVPAP